MNWQADNDKSDFFFFDLLLEKGGILIQAAAFVGDMGRSNLAIHIADGQTDADAAVIDAQKPAPVAHKYFSKPLIFKSSTSCLMAASSRRSATKVALPS